MCIIGCKPNTVPMFSDEEIRTMFRNNPDGAGLMYLRKNGKVHIEKGFFKVTDMLDYIHAHQRILDNTDVVVHFRIATSGKKTAVGCHPYPVWQLNTKPSCDVDMAMAHNGILDSYGWKGTDEVNDTETFIKSCLRKLPHNFLNNRAIVGLIEKSIGTNKLAFMDASGIHTIGKFVEDGGRKFSNETYKDARYTLASIGRWYDDYCSYTGPSTSSKSSTSSYTSKERVSETKFKEMMEDLFNGDELDTYEFTAYKDFKRYESIIADHTRIAFQGNEPYYYDDEYIYMTDVTNYEIYRQRLTEPDDNSTVTVDDGYALEERD